MGQRERAWTVVVLLAATILTFYRLGAGTLWDQDETKYAQVAREILQTGDPITLHVNGSPWYVHPPLYMWLVAATGKVFGFSTFTVRFWSGAASVLAVYATMLLGRALFNVRTGILAGAVLAVTFHFLVQSRLAVFDTVLLAFMLLAAYGAVRGYQRGRAGDYLAFFIFAGLATATKGPIGIVLPGLVMMAFVTARRAWGRWREVPWAAGLVLYAVIGLSWYAAETLLHGALFVKTVLGYYGVGRFFGVVEDQAGPWYYYAPILVLGAFPWTAFWPAAGVWHARRLRHDGSLFVVLWCGIVIVFYSVAQTKLPNYVLPVYPLAAIGIAALWDRLLERPDTRAPWWPLASAGLLVVLVAALELGIAHYLGQLYPAQYREFSGALLPSAITLAAGVAVAVAFLAAGRRAAGLIALCAAMAVTWLAVIAWVVPLVEAQKPMPAAAEAVARAWRPGDRVLGYRLDIYSSLIYYSGHPVEWINSPAALVDAVCRLGRVIVVIAASERSSVTLPKGLRVLSAERGVDVLLKPKTVQCPLRSELIGEIRPTSGRLHLYLRALRYSRSRTSRFSSLKCTDDRFGRRFQGAKVDKFAQFVVRHRT
jgi:4-amino-4-deoxy-L-arabinose transferase-like glycosyltransferase